MAVPASVRPSISISTTAIDALFASLSEPPLTEEEGEALVAAIGRAERQYSEMPWDAVYDDLMMEAHRASLVELCNERMGLSRPDAAARVAQDLRVCFAPDVPMELLRARLDDAG